MSGTWEIDLGLEFGWIYLFEFDFGVTMECPIRTTQPSQRDPHPSSLYILSVNILIYLWRTYIMHRWKVGTPHPRSLINLSPKMDDGECMEYICGEPI